MEIKPIEEKAYAQMKRAFKEFALEVEELCIAHSVENEWLDKADVYHYMHIQSRTLQKYRNTGILPFSMIRGKCYYKASDVQKLIDNSKHE